MFSCILFRSLLLCGVFVPVRAPLATAEENAQSRKIDLTHTFDESTIYWPTEKGFVLQRGPAGVTEQGYFYAANRFSCAEHGGTHVDAPQHFWKGGQTVDQIPLERLIGKGALIDVSRVCGADPDYRVTVEDLKSWEEQTNESLAGRIVLLYTGFCRHWPDRKAYLGTAEQGREAVAELHFPGLHPAAADWLVTKRQVLAVGIDTASIDLGQSSTYPTHVRLFRDNVPALENVANLDQLPPSGFTVIALPMKIKDGSGSPCRIVALIEE